MTGPISRNRLLGSLKEAASWPGADRNTVVTLATSLVAARADAEGSRYFQDLAERNPADPTAQALARSSPSDPRGWPFTWAFVMCGAGLLTTRRRGGG
jgi:hypothetical protein